MSLIISSRFLQAGLDNNQHISQLPAELKYELILRIDRVHNLLNPSVYKQIAQIDKTFSHLSLDFYKKKMNLFLCTLFGSIHPELEKNFAQKRVFESIHSFKDVYRTARLIIAKPLRAIFKQFGVTDLRPLEKIYRSEMVLYLSTVYRFALKNLCEVAGYRLIKNEQSSCTLSFDIESQTVSDALLWLNNIELYTALNTIFKIPLSKPYHVRISYISGCSPLTMGIAPMQFAIASLNADLFIEQLVHNLIDSQPVYTFDENLCMWYGHYILMGICHHLGIDALEFDENNWQKAYERAPNRTPEKLKQVCDFLARVLGKFHELTIPVVFFYGFSKFHDTLEADAQKT